MDQQQTLNLPSLLFVVLLTFFVLRYFFFSSSSTTSTDPRPQDSYPGTLGRGTLGRGGRTVDAGLVDQIASMFPQVGRREIMWDLQRNGGSVAATTERILGGRGLDVPPLSFQPPLASPFSSSTPGTSSATSKSMHPDLITRYNLSSKLNQSILSPDPSSSSSTETPLKSKQGWSQNKIERQALLQRRREEMILNARRKMEEKERLGGRVAES
ncbi:hypothetical protein MMC08_002362 [Hypocenomyce scalaris]|nr:hypothetical protein [Hypocenomyce scalaris]